MKHADLKARDGDKVRLVIEGYARKQCSDDLGYALSPYPDGSISRPIAGFIVSEEITEKALPRVGDIITGAECADLPIGSVVLKTSYWGRPGHHPRVKLRTGWVLTADGYQIHMPDEATFRVEYVPA